jgi:hypothetical protein
MGRGNFPPALTLTKESDSMAKATKSISTTIRVRLPRELLAVMDEWAAAHDLPRSKAIQALVLRGLAWDEVRQRQQQLAA